MPDTPNQFVSMAAAMLLGAAAALAQSSTNTVTYQGVLTQSGAPVADGTYTLTFKIYDAASGGTLVQTIAVPGVATAQGKFTALVPVTPSSFNGEDRWWSVTFNGVELPRQKVTAAPYAVRAASGGAPSGTFEVDGRAVVAGQVISQRGSTTSAAFVDNVVDDSIPNWRGTGVPASFFRVAGGTDQHAGFGIAIGDQIASPVIYYYAPFDRSAFQVREVNAAGASPVGPNSTAMLSVANHGVAIGAEAPPTGTRLYVEGQLSTSVLTIRGADVAEKFDIAPTSAELKPVPGMVVSIDPANPGKLAVSTTAYDKKVAGVISGANGLDAGVILGKGNANPLIDGEHPVAMTGRVWVFADQSAGEISPGDRLTTSGSEPGYAMKVIDEAKAPGSVIGKAMTRVDAATGMVLVLVNLQ